MYLLMAGIVLTGTPQEGGTMMDKMQISQNIFVPMPVVLVGMQVKKSNFMTMGWCTRANANPPMIVCRIGTHHPTPEGIFETGTFPVNILSAALLIQTDYCGIVSGERPTNPGCSICFTAGL